MAICAIPSCCAECRTGSAFCAVHDSVTRRECFKVGIRCYACGEPIRLHARMLVRAEGAFYLRPACLSAKPSTWQIQVKASAEA